AEITSPCQAMIDELRGIWNDLGDVAVIPNVFKPDARILSLSPETTTNRVTFVGRLELRKGVIGLARAIPRVLEAFPEAQFRMIGRSLPHPVQRTGMREQVISELGDCASRVEFIDGLPYEQALAAYGETDICVFPSIWENFPNVCLEAMAAARGVVG